MHENRADEGPNSKTFNKKMDKFECINLGRGSILVRAG
jgi:hypothetical protein